MRKRTGVFLSVVGTIAVVFAVALSPLWIALSTNITCDACRESYNHMDPRYIDEDDIVEWRCHGCNYLITTTEPKNTR